MAACVWEDFLKSRFSYVEEGRVTCLMKVIVFIFGAVCLGMAFLVASIGGTMVQLSSSFVGMSIGPMVGIYALAGMFTFTNAVGTVLGALLGFAVPIWMLLGYIGLGLQNQGLPGRTYSCFPVVNSTNITLSPFTTLLVTSTTSVSVDKLTGISRFYSVSFAWYPVIGFLVTLVAGLVISFVTGCGKSGSVEKSMICPYMRKCIGEKADGKIKCIVIKTNNMELTAYPEYTSREIGISADNLKTRNSYVLDPT